MTITEVAEALGLKSYDTALPQNWVDDFFKETGLYPVGNFVWSYDVYGTFGNAVPLNETAVIELIKYENKKSMGWQR